MNIFASLKRKELKEAWNIDLCKNYGIGNTILRMEFILYQNRTQCGKVQIMFINENICLLLFLLSWCTCVEQINFDQKAKDTHTKHDWSGVNPEIINDHDQATYTMSNYNRNERKKKQQNKPQPILNFLKTLNSLNFTLFMSNNFLIITLTDCYCYRCSLSLGISAFCFKICHRTACKILTVFTHANTHLAHVIISICNRII